MERELIKVSVRDLIEFVLRCGDIDNRRMDAMTKNAMAEGSRIHKKIQSRMGKDYHAEVPLKIEIEKDTYVICLEGRADGIIYEAEGIVIDEIKSMYANVLWFQEPMPIHLAQAKCYAYIYAKQENLEQLQVQLTYCNIETEMVKRFRETVTFEELEAWFLEVLERYLEWVEFLREERRKRNASIAHLEFPFPYRAGQRDIVVSVYKCIKQKRNLFIQAPTGVGKTLSTVFPAVRAIGEERAEKLFYLTAKTITRTVAEEAFSTLREKGLQFRCVTITAKEKICPMTQAECNPDACPRAKGHYDRVNAAIFQVLKEQHGIDRAVIEQYAHVHNVCPFEMSLDISNFVDGVICDYNYVFDPYVCLKRYFSEGVQGKYVFLVDEAHNLVERAREMYSAVMIKEDILLCRKQMKDCGKRITGALDKCNKEMLRLKRKCIGTQLYNMEETDTTDSNTVKVYQAYASQMSGKYTLLEEVEDLVLALLHLQGVLEWYLDENREFPNRQAVLEFYFQVRRFLDIYELVDENYELYADFTEHGDFFLKLFCVNPSGNLSECMKRAFATIFFSATLLPVNYYKELLSGNREEYAIYISSPFDEKKRLLTIGREVSSKYTRRGRVEYLRMLRYIELLVSGCKGNYMVFFPSYKLMEEIYELAEETGMTEDCRIICQGQSMQETEREEFLQTFESDNAETLLGFCVLGGIFSEGIDLKHDRLIGSIIVGTGLPQICSEREILKHYYNQNGKDGFDYAYRYPGMNKVLQAAGRVIRTDDDYGVIALLDERFLERKYLELFPREWADYQVVGVKDVQETVERFWRYC